MNEPVSLNTIARCICEKGNWGVTHLQLQKLIYMAQMLYMGRNGGAPLVDTRFEAWDYGPVSPDLYRKLRWFGAQPVTDVFDGAVQLDADDPRAIAIDEVCDALLKKSSGQLIQITHSPHGAWATHYVPGAKGRKIPNEDIALEYQSRLAATR